MFVTYWILLECVSSFVSPLLYRHDRKGQAPEQAVRVRGQVPAGGLPLRLLERRRRDGVRLQGEEADPAQAQTSRLRKCHRRELCPHPEEGTVQNWEDRGRGGLRGGEGPEAKEQ